MDSFRTMGSIHRHALLGVLVLSIVQGMGLSQEMNALDDTGFDIIRTPNETATALLVGSTVNITFTIIDIRAEGEYTITLEVLNDDFGLSFEQLQGVSQSSSMDNVTMNVNITGTKLVISEFNVVAVKGNGKKTVLLTHYVKVKRVPNRIAAIVRYLVTFAVIATIWLIGITTDIMVVYAILKRPFPVLIGMICQFVIMPFSAWSLAKIFQIDGPASLGLVLDGSCPGGTNSNLLSVLLDVDYVLSITMTFFSTILALGMMPLNLLIYGSSFVAAGETIKTPFFEIFLQLVFLVVPLAIGIFLGWKWPKTSEFADKYIKPVSAVVVVILISSDLPFNLYIFDSPWQYYIASIIFPFIGGVAGFIISKIARLTTRKAITVALETGVQNALLAVTVLYFFYPQPEADLATRLPYLILIFTTTEGIIFAIIYTLLKNFYWHGIPYDDEQEETEEDKETDPEKSGANNNKNDIKSKPSSEVASNPSGVVLVSTISRNGDSYGHANPAFNKSE